MATYEEFADKTRSEKVVLAWIQPVQRLLLFTLFSGFVYKKSVDHFVVGVKDSSTSLTEASSTSLNAGEWFFDAENKTLYVRASDDSDPSTRTISAEYRLFYSNLPYILPYDLESGTAVEYDSRIEATSSFSSEIDEEQTGIALEGQGSIRLINSDGHFDSLYDKLFFENKSCTIFSWSSSIPISQKRKLFEGAIESKSFDPSKVRFNIRDNVFQLRQPVPLTLFSASDGNLDDSDIGTPKRRIYGQVKQVQTIGLDKVLDGFSLTGTISALAGSTTLTGTGTAFLDETSPGDKIKIPLSFETLEFRVDSVTSDTVMTVSETINSAFNNFPATIDPDVPWRKKNRRWHLVGHKLRQPETTVVTAPQLNRITVADSTDMFADDLIKVDGEKVQIRRISDNLLVLENNLQAGLPSPGDSVVKQPVSKVWFGPQELILDRDWTLTNTTEAIIELNELAEFNVTPRKSIIGTITFTNSSRSVTGVSTAFKTDFRIRDWIQSDDLTHTTFYEILDIVDDTTLTLRVDYGGSTNAGSAFKKNVNLIDDKSLILADTIGLENASGEWVKTASDAVKDLVSVDAGLTINQASFTEADSDAPYRVSMVLPENIREDSPEIKSVINKINESVFGSLFHNQVFELAYNVLNAEKPEGLSELQDDDILKFSAQSNIDIFNKIKVKYSPFIDRFNGENTFDVLEYENEFVDNFIGTVRTKEVELLLFGTADAQTIAERIAFFHSLSQSVVRVDTKMNLSTKSLNDKVFINLNRLYERFAQFDKRKIGIISKITRDGSSTSVEFNDLGNIFNRIPAVGPDTMNDFPTSSKDERIKYGFVVDNTLEVPDTSSESELGANIIG